jgi:hypothetical protein
MNPKTLTELLSPYTTPTAPPKNYTPALDAVRWRFVRDTSITQEIFRRPEGTYGFRYCVWVAWSDAGGTIRDHTWHVLPGIEALVTDTVQSAVTIAESDAAARGVTNHYPWTATQILVSDKKDG